MRPHPPSERAPARLTGLLLALLIGAAAAGCAHHGASSPAMPASTVPVTEYEMEPIKITAVNGPEGMHIESFDAAELFEQGGKALGEKRFDDAITAYDRLLKEFDDARYAKAGLYNLGLAYQGKKDWPGALARFQALVARYPESPDAKDALFQLGATYAEVGNWSESAQILARVLERKDLTADDRLEALGRRGFAQFQQKDLDAAEKSFRSAVAYFHQIEKDERLETDFYLALALYHMGEISHERFRAVALRLPEAQMSADLDEKARLLLQSQRQYIETMKLGNPEWAAASGFQVGALYEELYDAFIHAPVPPELMSDQAGEEREAYYGELRKKIRVLLEKSSHWHDENLKMIERYGVKNEWRDKSKLAYAKIQQLLDPSYRAEFRPPGAATGAEAGARGPSPPVPPAPNRIGTPAGEQEPGVSGAPSPEEGDSRARRPERPRTGSEPIRQIL